LHAIAGGADRGPIVSATISLAALVVVGLTIAADLPAEEVGMGVAALVVLALGYRTLLKWQSLLIFTFLVILFIPIKRYELPGNLPFDLEPYRVSVILIMGAWITSLLIDPRVRLRASGIEAPLALIWFSSLGSVLVNGPRIDSLEVGPDVVKSLMFLGSFILVFYLIVSVVRTYEQVRLLAQVLVVGGAIVAGFAVVEAQTGFNVFNQLANMIPLLTLREAVGENLTRGGRLRVFASAQGAIPLGAALVMLLPLAFVMVRSSARPVLWWSATGIILLGALSSGSRTSVMMIVTLGLVFLWLRPAPTRRVLAVLLIPAVLAVHVVLPGTIGSLRSSFFPEGGLIAQQSENPGWRGSGRIADLGPAMEEFVASPLLGQGYGTRVTGRDPRANALILDDQWLKTLVETGAVGAFAWLWLFARFARRLGPAAKEDAGDRGWLMAAMVASVLAFAFGKLFYDAFAFIQVNFLLWIMLALGCVLLAAPAQQPVRAPAPRRVAARPRELPVAS
jgi:hypothetical protein